MPSTSNYEKFEEEASPVLHHVALLKKRQNWLLCLNGCLLLGVVALLIILGFLLYGLSSMEQQVQGQLSHVNGFIGRAGDDLDQFKRLAPLINNTLTTIDDLLGQFQPCFHVLVQWCRVPQE